VSVSRWALCVALTSLAWCPQNVSAHDIRPGGVALREVSPGVYTLRITRPSDGGVAPHLEPTFPPGCARSATGVRCTGRLAGLLRVPSLANRRVKVVVHVRYLDGTTFEGILTEGESELTIGDRSLGLHGAGAYFRIGVEHIIGGVDHLFFVLGLALIARRPKRIAVSVTGFTVAHSATLALSALGLVAPAGEAVELCIAASVSFLAAEAARGVAGAEHTLTHRAPVLVSVGFGLVHGFGFAGALTALGLPDDATLAALLMFNLGVEAGQLVVLAAAVAVALPLKRRLGSAQLPRARRLAAYALGLPAGVWTVERAYDFLLVLGP
jgi:hypothetical protein